MNIVRPIWLNGDIVSGAEPCISAYDRGFALGDGVFETIRAQGTRLLWLSDHLSRLRESADVLGIPMPMDDDAIAEGLNILLKTSAHQESVLRLTLSRGPSEKRGLWPPSPAAPTLLATVAELPAARPPLRLMIARSTRRNEHSPLTRIKSLNYGDNILARREAEVHGMDDALMLNCQGRIACTTVGNIFLKIDDRWRTPFCSEGALPGLARKRLLPILGAEERTISLSNLRRANAGFLSNSLGITEIQKIDGRRLQGIRELLDKLSLFYETA
jgi:branched-chain amino acid aminotransferase